MMAPPLEARGLTRSYGAVMAIRDLSFSVHAGEVVGFLGPNGAGKTTTLRLCSGLIEPDQGTVHIAGHALAAAPLAARARLGLVPDRAFLYERLTAREFLEFVAAIYELEPRAAAARGDELLGRLALGKAADDLIETYSLGMRQKTSIAAGLLHAPAIVLLDEPLSGLDPAASRALKDLLREHAGNGGGVLVSTHLLDVAERLCDRVVILHRGAKVAEGSLDQLRGQRANATLEDVFLELTGESRE